MTSVLEAIRSGDRTALDRFVADHTPLLWQVARAQGLDRDSASDVVQTTWLVFLRSMDQIRTPEAVVGWLVVAARREAWRVRRELATSTPVEHSSLAHRPGDEPDPGTTLAAREQEAVLWAAVRALPEKCQELIRLVAFAHRPDYDAVAAALDMRRGSIGPTRGRCLAKLRRLLGADPRWSRHD